MKIRVASALDAPGIGRVHVETWRSAYRGIVPDEYLAGLSAVERAGQWGDLLADQSGARFMLIADDRSDELIGFVAAGPERSRHPMYRREVYALYVLRSHQRRGVGRTLVRAVAGRLLAGGSRSMLLWVLDANAQARRFYEALGGTVVGEQRIEIGGVTLVEVAYGWPDVAALLKTAGPDMSTSGAQLPA
jgi:ribosomal protein S18 acetylase RimI-like enzyme